MLLPPLLRRWSESTLVRLTENSINLVQAPTGDVLRACEKRKPHDSRDDPWTHNFETHRDTRPCGYLRL